METDALMIMDNLKAAVANIWPKPHQMPIYAGADLRGGLTPFDIKPRP